MLPKSKRVPVQLVQKKPGKSKRLVHFLIKWHIKDSGDVRFGIVVGKKVAKKAVDRNALKRRIARVLSRLSFNLPFDVVISALPGSEQLGEADIQKELNQFLHTL